MSAPLSKDLVEKYNVNALPVRKDDVVIVKRGKFKTTEGRITAVYRKKYVIHVEKCTRDKMSGTTINIGIDPSKVVIKTLKLDKSRLEILSRKDRSAKGSHAKQEKETRDNLAGVD